MTMGELVAFADFVFNRSERILERAGRRIALAPKAAEALALLVAEPGALVTKETLRDTLWPAGYVEDNNLSQTIYVVRKALDPDGDGRAFIETLARRGYRFVAPVTAVVPAATPKPHAQRWKPLLLAASIVLALAIGPSAGAHRAVSIAAPLAGDAARAYALGRYYWDQRPGGLRASIGQFKRVIALAPQNALGYAGLADAYFMTGEYEEKTILPQKRAYALAEENARKALARDPNSAEATATLGYLAIDRDRDLQRAQRYIIAALTLQPNYATAHEFAGLINLYRGNVAGALWHFRRATELHPTSVPILTWYGIAQYYSGRYEEARTSLRDAIALAPSRPDARSELVLVDQKLGRLDEARALVRGLSRMPHKHGETWMLEALLDLQSHAKPAAVIAAKSVPRDAEPASVAALDAALGNRDAALRHLDQALRKNPEERLKRGMLAIDPLFATLHDDPRFRTLTSS
jgi:DNA-binding winged helix-turn-helix (wHTH) protein/Flp pilus assembly protein TadD